MLIARCGDVLAPPPPAANVAEMRMPMGVDAADWLAMRKIDLSPARAYSRRRKKKAA